LILQALKQELILSQVNTSVGIVSRRATAKGVEIITPERQISATNRILSGRPGTLVTTSREFLGMVAKDREIESQLVKFSIKTRR